MESKSPKTGAEADRNTRVRSPELPAGEDHQDLPEIMNAANHTANQTIDEGNENEVQGKHAVPYVKVQKRGSTKWIDEETGEFHKELNDAEINEPLAKEEMPEYLKLHQEVLDGAPPLEATLKYQNRDSKNAFEEGKLKNAETSPRTGGIGTAALAPENEEQKTATPENKNDR
jgi:hypothetical protein